jgi:hypothetical protein
MVIKRIIGKLLLARRRPGFRSRFGGLWIDSIDAERELAAKVARGAITATGAEQLRFWREHGYLTLPGAVPGATIDRINADMERIWRDGDSRLMLDWTGAVVPLAPGLREAKTKVLDLYAFSPAVLESMFAPAISDFLHLIFDGSILAFQSLSFEYGTEQEMHQDTAYVVVSAPLEMAASWIALQDVEPGTGELTYYDGSHRLDEFLFSGRYRNFNRKRDGEAAHRRYLDSLHEQAAARRLALKTFCPRKGDALIWSADLVHGGTRITRPGHTRRSLATHYCPGHRQPYYFTYAKGHRTRKCFAEECFYSSSHYRL